MRYLIDGLSSMKNLHQLNWIVTEEILATAAAGKLPYITDESNSLSPDGLQELLRRQLPQTNVKVVCLPEYATLRYSLSANHED